MKTKLFFKLLFYGLIIIGVGEIFNPGNTLIHVLLIASIYVPMFLGGVAAMSYLHSMVPTISKDGFSWQIGIAIFAIFLLVFVITQIAFRNLVYIPLVQ